MTPAERILNSNTKPSKDSTYWVVLGGVVFSILFWFGIGAAFAGNVTTGSVARITGGTIKNVAMSGTLGINSTVTAISGTSNFPITITAKSQGAGAAYPFYITNSPTSAAVTGGSWNSLAVDSLRNLYAGEGAGVLGGGTGIGVGCGHYTTVAGFAETSTLMRCYSATLRGQKGTITTLVGYDAAAIMTGGTVSTAYGYRSGIAATTNHWNFYASGTAANYFAGFIQNGSKTLTTTNALTTYTAATEYNYLTGTAGASFAITLPAAASGIDGQFVTVMSTAARAATTWASAGGTIVGAPASLTANTPVRLQYHHATTQWFITN